MGSILMERTQDNSNLSTVEKNHLMHIASVRWVWPSMVLVDVGVAWWDRKNIKAACWLQ